MKANAITLRRNSTSKGRACNENKVQRPIKRSLVPKDGGGRRPGSTMYSTYIVLGRWEIFERRDMAYAGTLTRGHMNDDKKYP